MAGRMEMDRGVAPPPSAPKTRQSAMEEFNMKIPSLEKKLKEHFNDTFSNQSSSSSSSSSSPTRRKRHFLTPDFIARQAVPVFLFTLAATLYLGMVVVVPHLYRDELDSDLLLQRIVMGVIGVEMLLNWLCIRYVDSSYFALLRKRWARSQNGGSATNNNNERVAASASSDVSSGRGSGSPWKPAFKPPAAVSFPYWSWVPCYVCEVMRPPRCHHCPVCQTCVLKRDHHCYFAGSCVGWRNQRYFVVFVAWALIGCLYGSYQSYFYFAGELWAYMRWFDLLFPVSIVRSFLGYVPGLAAFCVVIQSLLLYFILLSSGFLHEHVQLMVRSKTSFEMTSLKKNVELRDVRPLAARLRAVLGKNWLLSLLCPLHWVLEAQEDPENWPSIKIYRH